MSLLSLQVIPPGIYAIPEIDLKLGNSIDVLPLARRLKARDGDVVVYDPNSDTFKDIATRSGVSESGCMYGTSFLVFERMTGRFLEFFCGNSIRRLAAEIAPCLPLSQTQIDYKRKAGSVREMQCHPARPMNFIVCENLPRVQACSVPFMPRMNLPDNRVIVEEISKFLTDNGTATMEPGKKARTRRKKAS